MNPAIWVGLGLWIAGILVQIGIGRFTSRLAALEKHVETINRARSDEENKLQIWVGDIDVRMALLEQQTGIKKERRQWPRS